MSYGQFVHTQIGERNERSKLLARQATEKRRVAAEKIAIAFPEQVAADGQVHPAYLGAYLDLSYALGRPPTKREVREKAKRQIAFIEAMGAPES